MTPAILAAAIFVLLTGGTYAAFAAFTPPHNLKERERLAQVTEEESDEPTSPSLHRRDWAPGLTILLRAFKLHDRIQWEILKAGLLLKPSEMTVLSLAAGGGVFLIGSLATKRLAASLMLSLFGMMVPWGYVMVRKTQRAKYIITQLPEALQLIASSLRSGFSILRAIRVAGDEMPPPISQEFTWLVDEVNVGISMENAFGNMAQRTQSSDVRLLVTAVQIQSKVGGNLAEVLETTAEMIRERFQLTAEIAALTSEGRLSAGVLTVLPIGLALMITVLNPNYLRPLITEPIGIAMLVVGGTLMLLGLLVIKAMLNVDV